MILLDLYRGIWWSSYRGINLSDDTVMDHREIVIIVWYMLI